MFQYRNPFGKLPEGRAVWQRRRTLLQRSGETAALVQSDGKAREKQRMRAPMCGEGVRSSVFRRSREDAWVRV